MAFFKKLVSILSILTLFFSSCLSIKSRRYNSGLSIGFNHAGNSAIGIGSCPKTKLAQNKTVTVCAQQQTFMRATDSININSTSLQYINDSLNITHLPASEFKPIAHVQTNTPLLRNTASAKKQNIPIEPFGFISLLLITISICLLAGLLLSLFGIIPAFIPSGAFIPIICGLLVSWIPTLVFALISLKKHNRKPKDYCGKGIPKITLILTLIYFFALGFLTVLFLLFAKIY